jgi:hypothetical protein
VQAATGYGLSISGKSSDCNPIRLNFFDVLYLSGDQWIPTKMLTPVVDNEAYTPMVNQIS